MWHLTLPPCCFNIIKVCWEVFPHKTRISIFNTCRCCYTHTHTQIWCSEADIIIDSRAGVYRVKMCLCKAEKMLTKAINVGAAALLMMEGRRESHWGRICQDLSVTPPDTLEIKREYIRTACPSSITDRCGSEHWWWWWWWWSPGDGREARCGPLRSTVD